MKFQSFEKMEKSGNTSFFKTGGRGIKGDIEEGSRAVAIVLRVS